MEAHGISASKEVQAQPSADKVMATIFWDMDGVVMIDYLPPKSNTTGQ